MPLSTEMAGPLCRGRAHTCLRCTAGALSRPTPFPSIVPASRATRSGRLSPAPHREGLRAYSSLFDCTCECAARVCVCQYASVCVPLTVCVCFTSSMSVCVCLCQSVCLCNTATQCERAVCVRQREQGPRHTVGPHESSKAACERVLQREA